STSGSAKRIRSAALSTPSRASSTAPPATAIATARSLGRRDATQHSHIIDANITAVKNLAHILLTIEFRIRLWIEQPFVLACVIPGSIKVESCHCIPTDVPTIEKNISSLRVPKYLLHASIYPI